MLENNDSRSQIIHFMNEKRNAHQDNRGHLNI